MLAACAPPPSLEQPEPLHDSPPLDALQNGPGGCIGCRRGASHQHHPADFHRRQPRPPPPPPTTGGGTTNGLDVTPPPQLSVKTWGGGSCGGGGVGWGVQGGNSAVGGGGVPKVAYKDRARPPPRAPCQSPAVMEGGVRGTAACHRLLLQPTAGTPEGKSQTFVQTNRCTRHVGPRTMGGRKAQWTGNNHLSAGGHGLGTFHAPDL